MKKIDWIKFPHLMKDFLKVEQEDKKVQLAVVTERIIHKLCYLIMICGLIAIVIIWLLQG